MGPCYPNAETLTEETRWKEIIVDKLARMSGAQDEKMAGVPHYPFGRDKKCTRGRSGRSYLQEDLVSV